MLRHISLATWCLICIRVRRTYNTQEQEYYRRSTVSQSSMWTRKRIKPTKHCLSFLVNNMSAQSTRRAPLESRRKKPSGRTQRGGMMMLRSGTKTGSNQLKKETHGCQSSSRIYLFYVPVLKVMVNSVVTWWQRRTVEKLSVSVKLHSIYLKVRKTSSSTSRGKASNRRKKCLIKKEALAGLIAPLAVDVLQLASFSNEIRRKDDVGSRTFIAVLKQNTD